MHRKIKTVTLSAVLFVAVASHCAMAESDNEVRQYTIKQSSASVGTNLKKDIVKTGTIPLNKSYKDLTDAQKATLKDEYDNMPAGDEPPFPENGLMPIYRAIGTAHENSDYENVGAFSMEITVGGDGQARSVDILSSPSDDISTAATFAAMHVKYKPAVCNGQPCAMKLPIHAELVSPGTTVLKSLNAPGVNLTTPH